MEHESLLLHSQVSATCPYPEPARSIPYPNILLPEDPSYYYPIIRTGYLERTKAGAMMIYSEILARNDRWSA